MIKRVLLFICLLLFTAIPIHAQEPSENHPVVRIAYCEYMPFYFKGSNGEPRGILVDFWNLWSRKTGIPVAYIALPWNETLTYIREGKAELNPAIFFTPERDDYLDFSQPFFELATGLFYHKTLKKPLQGIHDLAERKVGGVAGDFNTQYIQKNQPDAILVEYLTHEKMVEAAIKKEIEAFVTESPVAMTYLAKLDGLGTIRKADKPIHINLFHAAVREGNTELLEWVNKGLSAITTQETEQIVSSWTGEPREKLSDSPGKKMTIASSIDSIPFHFVDENGNPVGMLIDFWRLWSEKNNVPIEFRNGDFGDTLEFVRNGSADLHAGLFHSKGREEYFDYTLPLCSLNTHFFFHTSIFGLKTLEDLVSFKIGVIQGDYAVEFLKEKLPGAALALYPNNNALFDALKRGEVRVFVKDTPIALSFLANEGLLHEYRYHPEHPLYTKDFHSAVKKGDSELLAKINQGIKNISGDERAGIERRWMGTSHFKTEDVLIIACSKGYPPFTFLNADGKPVGMFIDIWNLWSEKTGKQIEFRVSSWEDTLNDLKSGRADIHSGLFHTLERSLWIDFSQPLYQTRSNLFYPSQYKDISDMNALTGQKVGALRGGYAADFLHKNRANVEVIEFETSKEMIMAAADGNIRAFLDEAPSVLSLLIQLGKSGEFKYLEEPLYGKKVFAGISKGEKELLTLIENGIKAISHEEFIEIEKRWIIDPDARYFRAGVREIKLTPGEEAWIQKHTLLRVGVGTSWAPFQYVEDAHFKGMASDYIQMMNERLGLRMEVVKGLTWSEVLEKGKKREIDIFACVTETPERRTFMNFTQPYLSSPLVIITRKDTPFVGGLQDLYGKKVALVKKLATYSQIKQNHPAIIPYFVNTPPETLDAVSLGRADACLENLMVASYLIQKKGLANLKVAAPSELENTDLCFGIRNDWKPLVNILNKGIDSITSEEHNAIRQKWVAVRYEYGIDTAYIWRLGLQIGGVVIFILAMVFFWNIQIRRREERFRGLTEHGTDITQAFRADGTVVYQSPSHTALLGYDENELLGTSAFELFHQDDMPQWEKVMASLLRKEAALGFIHRLCHKSGGYRYFESNCINLLENKALKAIVINARDITERRATEEALLESNKKIMSSIQYAKKIQWSLMPDMDMIKSYLPKSLIIWMPRDIVGGDILFAEFISVETDRRSVSTSKKGLVIAVIDCTGHGVPGAFMTMIASSGLRRIIKDEACHDPAEILKRLNFFVKTTLQQDTEHAHSDDGLDAVICFIEAGDSLPISPDPSPLNPHRLTFAGARLPLYYIQDNELYMIKGDKQSIGYKRSNLKFDFTNHFIQIEEEMAFYIATDGFTDQMGGEKKRLPFTRKRFKALLKKVWNEPFEKQQEILLQSFKEYQGRHDRQDDVTVVGFGLKK